MQARTNRKIGATLTLQQQFEAANQAWEQAENYLGDLSDPRPNSSWDEWIELQTERVLYYYWQDDRLGMNRICDRLLPIVEQLGTPLQKANASYGYHLYLFRTQRYVVTDEVMAAVEKNVRFAAQTGKLISVYDHQFTAGLFHLVRRELNEAETRLRTCLDLAERMGDPVRISRAANYLMFLGRMRGQPEAAQRYFETVLSTTWAGPMSDYTFAVLACQSWIAWRAGKLTEARSYGMASKEKMLGLTIHYPFRWLTLFPLMGVAVAENQLAEAVEYAQLMLDPRQMIFPDDLTAALEVAVKLGEPEPLDAARQLLTEALMLATKYGYL